MSGQIIYVPEARPDQRHACVLPNSRDFKDRTCWQCDCGTVFVVNGVGPGATYADLWTYETRSERRARKRAQRGGEQ